MRHKNFAVLCRAAATVGGPAMVGMAAVAAPTIEAMNPIGYRIIDGVADMTNPLDGSTLSLDTGLSSTASSTGAAPQARSIGGPDERDRVSLRH